MSHSYVLVVMFFTMVNFFLFRLVDGYTWSVVNVLLLVFVLEIIARIYSSMDNCQMLRKETTLIMISCYVNGIIWSNTMFPSLRGGCFGFGWVYD